MQATALTNDSPRALELPHRSHTERLRSVPTEAR